MGNDTLHHPKKEKKVVNYIVLELAQGGELFDFVANSGRFNEKVARTYFH
jgi:serine/threonine protein kinase